MKLAALPDLGVHEIVASQLASNGMDSSSLYKSDHIGCTVVVENGGTVFAGKLRSVTDGIDVGMLVLGIGYLTVGVPLNRRVTVIPEGYRLQFTATPAAEPEETL